MKIVEMVVKLADAVPDSMNIDVHTMACGEDGAMTIENLKELIKDMPSNALVIAVDGTLGEYILTSATLHPIRPVVALWMGGEYKGR